MSRRVTRPGRRTRKRRALERERERHSKFARLIAPFPCMKAITHKQECLAHGIDKFPGRHGWKRAARAWHKQRIAPLMKSLREKHRAERST